MLTLRNTKGSPLTWGEIDGNFTYLDGLIAGKAAAAHGHILSDVSGLQTSLDAKAPLADPNFTGSVNLATAAAYGYYKASNTANGLGVLFGTDSAGHAYAWNQNSAASNFYIGNGNAANTGSLFLYARGVKQVQVEAISGANQYLSLRGDVTNGPRIIATDGTGGGAGANPNLYLSSGGVGSVYIYTNNVGSCAARFDHTANAARFVTITGATSSGSPTIGTNGGQLLIAGTNPVVNGSVGNGLQYLDVANSHTGSSAGSAFRLISSNAAGSGTTSFDLVKYKSGAASLINNEPSSSGVLNLGTYGAIQVRVDAIQYANRIITLAGSNGANPTIGVTGGNLAITPAVIGGANITASTFLSCGTYASIYTSAALPAAGNNFCAVSFGVEGTSLSMGVGIPMHNPPNGSVYFNSTGGAGTTMYQRRSGIWVATAA